MSMTIVVVDDETPICEWLAFCIRKASDSYQVRTATNGEEAYALIMREKPDIVFTDIRMPGMNGLDLMRKVLGRLPQTIFAVLTNHAEFSYAQQALSLGAREYFLKSELRVADIEAFIEGVLKIKEELAVIKKEDVFPSGCIDLFRLFKHQEEVDIVDQFWAKQGMAEKEAYLVLALETTHDPELWRLILQVPAKVLRSSMGKIYTAVSRIRGNHYLVLQAADESLLDSLAHAFADMIGDTTSLSVGISPVHHSRSDYMTASNQASLALNALFFSSKTMAHFEDLRACPLDRAHFHSEKAAVLDLVAQRRYGEASAAISSWFDALTCAGPPDIDWAIDYCRRMVLAIEERYYQLTNTSTQEIQQIGRASCRERV